MEILRGSKVKCFAILKDLEMVHFQCLDLDDGPMIKKEIEILKHSLKKLESGNKNDFQKVSSKNGSYILNTD